MSETNKQEIPTTKYFVMYKPTDQGVYALPEGLKEYFSQFDNSRVTYISKHAHSFHVIAPKGLTDRLEGMDLVTKVRVMNIAAKGVYLSGKA